MTQAHTTRAHARLAPSAAKRWINCPGSVKATEHLPDSTSEAAAEGTAAHELCSLCLETGANPSDYAGMYVDIKTKDPAKRFVDTPEDTSEELRFFEIDDEMVDGVQMYVDHVMALIDQAPGDAFALEVEQRLDMTHLHPEIFGTGDATVLDIDERHLHVVDFKYGKGIAVDADDNPQLLLYAAGAARRHHNARIEKLTMHIVQPRAAHPKGPIREFPIDLIDLFDFEDKIQAAALATDAADAPFNPGPWCHDSFCKLQGACPANRSFRLEAAGAEFGEIDLDVETVFPPVETLTPEQEAKILREADGLLSYTKAVQQRAHDKAINGSPPAGFKLVAKRANRKWMSEDDAVKALKKLKATPDEYMTEPKLRSPAQLEKLWPGKNAKERQANMADLVEKKSSGVNLVPVDDPRPAVQVGANADFDAVEM